MNELPHTINVRFQGRRAAHFLTSQYNMERNLFNLFLLLKKSLAHPRKLAKFTAETVASEKILFCLYFVREMFNVFVYLFTHSQPAIIFANCDTDLIVKMEIAVVW